MKYNSKFGPVPNDLKGQTFQHIFGKKASI